MWIDLHGSFVCLEIHTSGKSKTRASLWPHTLLPPGWRLWCSAKDRKRFPTLLVQKQLHEAVNETRSPCRDASHCS